MIVQAVCNSYKIEILEGKHKLDDEYKIALFTEEAELNKNTKSYLGALNEVEGDGYETGGLIISQKEVILINDTAVLNFNERPLWVGASFTARGALIYNNSLPEKNSIAVLNFGKNYICLNNNFEIEFPASGENTSLIRII